MFLNQFGYKLIGIFSEAEQGEFHSEKYQVKQKN